MTILLGDHEVEAMHLGNKMIFEVWVGDSLIWPKPENIARGVYYDGEGVGYTTLLVPWWTREAHIFAMGAGGGGGGGDGAIGRWGRPGSPGQAQYTKYTREPGGGEEIRTQIHPAGKGGEKEKNGGAGGSTIVEYQGGILTAAGGAGGSGYSAIRVNPSSPQTISLSDPETRFGPQTFPDYYPDAGYGGGGGRGGTFGNAGSGEDGRRGIVFVIFTP